jgi:hypothetical protein
VGSTSHLHNTILQNDSCTCEYYLKHTSPIILRSTICSHYSSVILSSIKESSSIFIVYCKVIVTELHQYLPDSLPKKFGRVLEGYPEGYLPDSLPKKLSQVLDGYPGNYPPNSLPKKLGRVLEGHLGDYLPNSLPKKLGRVLEGYPGYLTTHLS